MNSSEKPFGDYSIITKDNLDWLAIKLNSFRVKRLRDKIAGTAIDLEDDGENNLLLSCGLIKIGMKQFDSKTSLSFLPYEELELNSKFLYRLFFSELPQTIYGLNSLLPSPEFIQNSTIVTLKTEPQLFIKTDLSQPFHKEYFEDYLINKNEEIISLTMETKSDDVVPFSLTLPNLSTNLEDIIFSFASRDILTLETMDLLLKLHRNGTEMKSKQNVYAKTFAEAINSIIEETKA